MRPADKVQLNRAYHFGYQHAYNVALAAGPEMRIPPGGWDNTLLNIMGATVAADLFGVGMEQRDDVAWMQCLAEYRRGADAGVKAASEE